MDNPIKIEGKIFQKEFYLGMKMMLERYNPSEMPCEPPSNLNEFEDRLGELLIHLKGLFFGLAQDVETGKTLKKEKGSEALAKALCNYEKYCQTKHDIFFANGIWDLYNFLKLVLERDVPLLFNEIYILGVTRDRAGLSLPQKNVIAVQAAAQILWHLEKDKIPNIKEMRGRLKNKENPLYTLLELPRFGSRTIEDWIREVFPVPHDERRGQPSKEGVSKGFFNELIPIPEIFLEEGKKINFLKLRFAISCLTRVLKTFGWSREEICKSDFILF